MNTDLQTPFHPRPPTGPRLVSPRVVAGVAAVLVAATTTGVLIATAANRPAQEPAVMTGSPSASRSVSAPAPAGAPTVTAPPTGPTDTGSVPAPAGDDDVDGDGRRDVVSLPAAGTLRIRYATGLTNTVAFDAMAGEGRLLGIADADKDGRGEVFVHVGAGAYTDQTSVFRYVDGRLRLVTLDGKQMWLVSGASVRHSTSWACRPPHTPIVVWSGESDDGTAYHGTLNSYRFSGATLTQISSRPLTTDDLKPPPRHCGQIRT
jgi:hypothetical protein